MQLLLLNQVGLVFLSHLGDIVTKSVGCSVLPSQLGAAVLPSHLSDVVTKSIGCFCYQVNWVLV